MGITKCEEMVATVSNMKRSQEEPIKDAYKVNHESEFKSDCATGKQVKQVAMLVSVTTLFSQWKGKGESSLVYLLAWAVSLSVTRSCICQEDDCWQKVCWRGGAPVPRF